MTTRIKALHSYDVPEIVTLPIISGNPAYLDWIRESTA
jgi:periplasmic divalent cation tolerance protein